jgi:ankyrin
MVIDRH